MKSERWEIEQVELSIKTEARQLAIANCEMCDDRGYRGTSLCRHSETAVVAAERGFAAATAMLAAAKGINAAKTQDTDS